MRRVVLGSTIILAVSVTAELGLASDLRVYVVRSGDTLSQVAQALLGKPIYGRGKNLERMIAANPKIKNPNQLLTGVVLAVPDNKEMRLPASILDSTPSETTPVAPEQLAIPARPADLINPVEVNILAPPDPTEEGRFLLGVTPAVTFLRIDSTDKLSGATAVLASNMGPGLRVGLEFQLNSLWSYSANYRIQEFDFVKPKNKAFSQDGRLLNEVGVTIGYRGSRLPISLGLAMAERYFPAFESPTTLALVRTLVPRAQLSTRINFFENKRINLGLGAGAGILFSSSTESCTLSTGYNVFLRPDIRYQMTRHLAVSTGFRIDSSTQDSSQVTYRALGTVFDIGLEWWFEPNKEKVEKPYDPGIHQ